MIFLKRIWVLLFILSLMSCSSSKNFSNLNMSSLYRPSDNVFHPEINIWNQVDSTILISVKLNLGEFLFARQSDESFSANVGISCQVLQSYDDSKILDSLTSFYSFKMQDKNISNNVTIKLPLQHYYDLLLKVIIFDKNKNYSEEFFEPFSFLMEATRNDFRMLNKSSEIVFHNYVTDSTSFQVQFKDSLVKEGWCKYYSRNFQLPPPPFSFDVRSDFDYHPDSVFMVHLNDSSGFPFSKKGFYFFQTDTTKKTGFTVFKFENGYPSISTPKQLLEPLRYLTSKKEYEELESSQNIKKAVDSFWLARGGNEERTRTLIKKFYGRVQDANRYFSSYLEGWRTDRGMLYIIFGAPNALYLSSNSESWTYGTPNSTLALNFFFVQVKNPFTNNDYSLSRSPIYESNWYRAVETWRQGRIYNTFN